MEGRNDKGKIRKTACGRTLPARMRGGGVTSSGKRAAETPRFDARQRATGSTKIRLAQPKVDVAVAKGHAPAPLRLTKA